MSILRPSKCSFTCLHVRFCVCRATPSRRVRRQRTRRRLLLPGDYCAVSRSLWHQLLLSGARLMLQCKAPLISLNEKGLERGWSRGPSCVNKAQAHYLPHPVSHKSHPSIPSVTPAGSVSRLIEEYIPWLWVFGDVRCQTIEFLNRLGIYFLWGQKKRITG